MLPGCPTCGAPLFVFIWRAISVIFFAVPWFELKVLEYRAALAFYLFVGGKYPETVGQYSEPPQRVRNLLIYEEDFDCFSSGFNIFILTPYLRRYGFARCAAATRYWTGRTGVEFTRARFTAGRSTDLEKKGLRSLLRAWNALAVRLLLLVMDNMFMIWEFDIKNLSNLNGVAE